MTWTTSLLNECLALGFYVDIHNDLAYFRCSSVNCDLCPFTDSFDCGTYMQQPFRDFATPIYPELLI